jgi:ribonuclease D
MSRRSVTNYTHITTKSDLDQFYQQHENVDWLGFDTEFIGEKRFFTKLCLVQIASEHGLFIIDPLAIDDLSPLLELIQSPDILKITHAGENDYRLLFHQDGITPRHIFDTQIAAGFLGYRYPLSFGKLVEAETGRRLAKGYTVADWESRPLNPKQLKYALNDVIPLYELYTSLREKLEAKGRFSWVMEECQKLESPAYYQKDPHSEALKSNLIKSLKPRERVFLIRLFEWRTQLAREQNYSKEMVLPQKSVGHIVRTIGSGVEALHQHRRINPKLVRKYGETFYDLYNKPVTPFEEELLARIPGKEEENPKEDLMMDMLFLLIKYRCFESGVSTNLVIQRNGLKRLHDDDHSVDMELAENWKHEILGNDLIEWLHRINDLEVVFEEGQAVLRLAQQ